ncbi:hypothetical protein MIMGU_mgv1a017559mg [Erythranthe guttata]|uniref:Uncharacterized protein n=1 Tax=Erythranthe guttata TaxID=4155 RepID=A0A022RBK7_ERYGU|nr:hypothetical protein MIMGU_mgv1a017559mg [Erythranthe guttata]
MRGGSFKIVLPITPETPTRTKPPNHHRNSAEYSNHRKNSDNGSDRPVTRIRRVRLLLCHLHRRRLL